VALPVAVLLIFGTTNDLFSGWMGNFLTALVSGSITILFAAWTVEVSLYNARVGDAERKFQERVKDAELLSLKLMQLHRKWFFVARVENILLHKLKAAESKLAIVEILEGQINALNEANDDFIMESLRWEIFLQKLDLAEKDRLKNVIEVTSDFMKKFDRISKLAAPIFNRFKDYHIQIVQSPGDVEIDVAKVKEILLRFNRLIRCFNKIYNSSRSKITPSFSDALKAREKDFEPYKNVDFEKLGLQ
jgi:hypothetical protein